VPCFLIGYALHELQPLVAEIFHSLGSTQLIPEPAFSHDLTSISSNSHGHSQSLFFKSLSSVSLRRASFFRHFNVYY